MSLPYVCVLVPARDEVWLIVRELNYAVGRVAELYFPRDSLQRTASNANSLVCSMANVEDMSYSRHWQPQALRGCSVD